MKNRNIQFKPTAGLLIPLLLACFATVFISAPTPTLANGHDDDQPFGGTVSGTFPEDLGEPLPGTNGCVFSITVPNSGNSNQLGQFTGTAEFFPNLCDGSYSGTYQWVTQNGDTISGPFRGQLIPTATPGVFYNTETTLITSGTGRFKHATSMCTSYGEVNFNTRTFVLPWLGTISGVGNH